MTWGEINTIKLTKDYVAMIFNAEYNNPHLIRQNYRVVVAANVAYLVGLLPLSALSMTKS